jgi:phage terminase Nu1 subunit (DNA packaging protein)
VSLRYLSISQLAEVFDLDRATVRKRIAEIKPYKVESKRTLYDASEVAKVLFNAPKTDINKQLLDEQLRYEQARADKMILEVEKQRGEVVAIVEVARIVGSEYTNVRTRLLSIPSRCAKDLSLETDPALVKARLDQEMNEALSELTADTAFEETNQDGDESQDSSDRDPTEGIEAAAKTKRGGMG